MVVQVDWKASSQIGGLAKFHALLLNITHRVHCQMFRARRLGRLLSPPVKEWPNNQKVARDKFVSRRSGWRFGEIAVLCRLSLGSFLAMASIQVAVHCFLALPWPMDRITNKYK